MSVRTPDLGLAAALLTLGHALVHELEDGEDARQKVFVFEMSDTEFQSLTLLYQCGQLFVDSKRNALSIKQLKRMLQGVR